MRCPALLHSVACLFFLFTLALSPELRTSGASELGQGLYTTARPSGNIVGVVPARELSGNGFPGVVDVRSFGAVAGDGLDDSASFASALSGGNRTVLIPDGQWEIGGSTAWLSVEDNTTIVMGRNAVLNFTGDNASYRYGFRLFGVGNVKISGGILKGNRDTQRSGIGIGILISGGPTAGSHDVFIEDVHARDWYFDGFSVGGGSTTSHDVKFLNCTSSNSRRNGMSVTGKTHDISIAGCMFDNTKGTSPQAGLDLEPDTGETATRIFITGSTASNNVGNGFYIMSGSGNTTYVTVSDSSAFGNGANGLMILNIDKGIIVGNKVYNNINAGLCAAGSSYMSIFGNYYDNNARNIELNGIMYSSVIGNVVNSSRGDSGVVIRNSAGLLGESIIFNGNVVDSSGNFGLEIQNSSNISASSNIIKNSIRSGLFLVKLYNSFIKDNLIVGNNTGGGSNDGIVLGESENNYVSGNIVRHSGRWHTGTARAGSGTTITLASTASSIDDFYNGQIVETTDGTGAGQAVAITDYNGTTNVATVAGFDHPPDAGTRYIVRNANRQRYGIFVAGDAAKKNFITTNDLLESGSTGAWFDGGTNTRTHTNNTNQNRLD